LRLWHDMHTPNKSVAKVLADDGAQAEVYIEANVTLSQLADCWAFLLLPICMALGEDLEIFGNLSESVADSFVEAQNELLLGHKNLSTVRLIHHGDIRLNSQGQDHNYKTALFFSGGLDSTFAAESLDGIDALISVWGFDIPAKNSRHWQLTLDLVKSYAASTNRELITVKTNIRELSNPLLVWGRDYHGTALSGIATALAAQFGQVLVAAGYVRQDPNWGHSPTIFAAYSNNRCTIEQTEPVLRIAKAAALADNPRTKLIRVCYRNQNGLANCVTCKKCVRTRLEFDLVKAHYRPLGLETRPTFAELAQGTITNWDYLFYREAIDWAKAHGFGRTFSASFAVALARLRSKVAALVKFS